ncbi:MAG: efflux RND transporter periplasmic adaptor subunit [Elusimicrobiota bacterium]
MKKGIIWGIAGILVVGSFTAFLFYKQQENRKVKYKTVKIASGNIIKSIITTGTLNPVTLVEVGSQISGRIKAVNVDYNSLVKQGDIIAEIDPATLNAQLLNAEAALTKAQINVKEAKRKLDRTKALFEKQLVAQSELDTAETDYELSLANQKQAESSLNQAKTNLTYTIIRSPIDGVVILRRIDPGQTVSANLSAPTLFNIANDLKRMQINASVDEADIGGIKPGQKVFFTVDAFPEEKFLGIVAQVRYSPTVTQNVVTYDVIINVRNEQMKLRPGMTANVTIVIDRRQGVLKISNAALRYKPLALYISNNEGNSGTESKLLYTNKISSATTTQAVAAAKAATPFTTKSSTDKQRQGERSGAGKRKGLDKTKEDKPLGMSGNEDLTGIPFVEKPLPKIWLLRNGKPVSVEIEIGITDGKYSEILSGNLKAGDDVVTEEYMGKLKGNTGVSSQQSSPFMPGGLGGRR